MAYRAIRSLCRATSQISEAIRPALSASNTSKAIHTIRPSSSLTSNSLKSLIDSCSSSANLNSFMNNSKSQAYECSSFQNAKNMSNDSMNGESAVDSDQSLDGSESSSTSESDPVTDDTDPVIRGSKPSSFSPLSFHLPPPTLKPGRATPEGTACFVERFKDTTGDGHFRNFYFGNGLEPVRLSSVGVGTFLRASKPSADLEYEFIINHALKKGINVFDSNILTRKQYSERCIGRVLQSQINEGRVKREEVFISTKGGMLFSHLDPVEKDQWLEEVYYKNGVFQPSDIFKDLCIEPKFLEQQINLSRRNLGVECIDLYYLQSLHLLLQCAKKEKYIEKVKSAFDFLERKCKQGKIASYGIYSTKSPLLEGDTSKKISIPELISIAKEVGGDGHRFKSIQVPVNLYMMEMLSDKKAQMYNGKHVSVMDCAKLLNLNVFSSTMHYQGTKFRDVLDRKKFGLKILGENAPFARQALQFTRTLPDLTSALASFQTKREAINLFKSVEFPCQGSFTEKSKRSFEEFSRGLEE